MKQKIIRPDLIFSYWIFIWWILYILKITDFNPKFIIIVAIVQNLIIIAIKLYYKNYCSIIPFFIINSIIKLIPLITLWDTQIKLSDIYFSILIFSIHILWLTYNDKLKIIYNFKWAAKKEQKQVPLLDYMFNKYIFKC